jgi:hypothetical protein
LESRVSLKQDWSREQPEGSLAFVSCSCPLYIDCQQVRYDYPRLSDTVRNTSGTHELQSPIRRCASISAVSRRDRQFSSSASASLIPPNVGMAHSAARRKLLVSCRDSLMTLGSQISGKTEGNGETVLTMGKLVNEEERATCPRRGGSGL